MVLLCTFAWTNHNDCPKRLIRANYLRNILKDICIKNKFKIENDELIMYKSIEKEGDLSEYFTFNMINGEKLNYYDLKLSNS